MAHLCQPTINLDSESKLYYIIYDSEETVNTEKPSTNARGFSPLPSEALLLTIT